MRLQPITRSAFSGVFERMRLGSFEIGRCINQPDPRRAPCDNIVFDDGKGYADLDGKPFKAYYCAECASKLLATTTGESK